MKNIHMMCQVYFIRRSELKTKIGESFPVQVSKQTVNL